MKIKFPYIILFSIFFPLIQVTYSQAELESRGAGLQGYISGATGVPSDGYNMGYGFYSGVWSLTSNPIKGFQIGLPATWIIPDNRDNTTEPLCPEGTVARNWSERQPTFDGVFQTVEGGLGYWAGNRFHYGPPKYSMNSVPNCYNGEIASPGWEFFGTDEPLPDHELGIAQLSNRMLIPPDGLTFDGNPINDFLGFAYLALPLTEKKTTPVKVGNNCWTLFINSDNFKGPLSFVVPDTWVKIAEGYPFIAERGLDARPAAPLLAAGTMEINTVPFFSSIDNNGVTYTKIPELQFPIVEGNRTILARDVTYYSKDALYNKVLNWKDNGTVPLSKFNSSGIEIAPLTTWPVVYKQDDIALEGINDKAKATVFSDQSFGLEWSNPSSGQFETFPQYFKEQGGKRVAIAKSDVPQETGLVDIDFDQPNANPSAYHAELIGAWANPGPSAGPYTITLNDKSVVTYYWYRFIDQPVFQQYNWSQEHRDKLQSLIEKMHTHWEVDDEYIAPISEGELVRFDPNLLVTPPAGMEIGYVPIVTRQSNQIDLDCNNLNLNLSSTLSMSNEQKQIATLNANSIEKLTIRWNDGSSGNTTIIDGQTYSAAVSLGNCIKYHYSAPFALSASGVDQTSFFANWEQVQGAKGYIIDVAKDVGFNQFLSGWNNREIDNIAKIEVPLINGTTKYFYRLSTIGFEGEKSEVSNVIQVDINQTNCAIEIVSELRNVASGNSNDGEIILSPKGGSEPYGYKWSNGSTQRTNNNLSKGLYSVTITDAANCQVTKSFEIGLPIGTGSLGNRVWHDLNRNGYDDFGEPGIPGVKVALWKDNNGDGDPESWQGFEVTDAGGYYMHTNLSPGIYQLFVWEIDNFTENGPLHNMINTKGNYNPNNDIDKDDNGQPASELQAGLNDINIISKRIVLTLDNEPLNDGDRPDSNFNYDPSGNMTIDFGFFKNNNNCPVINLNITGTAEVCTDEKNGNITAEPVSGLGPFTYLWNTNDVSPTLENLSAGDYSVTMADANGCTGTANYLIKVRSTAECSLTSIDNTLPEDITSFYPNPSSRFLNMDNNHSENLIAHIYGIDGNKYKSLVLKQGKNKVFIEMIPDGMYIVKISNPKTNAYLIKKFIKM